MKKIIILILFTFAVSAHAEFKLDSLDDLEKVLEAKEPQGIGLALGYVKGVQDGILMMAALTEEDRVKYKRVSSPDRNYPSVMGMVKLLRDHKNKNPGHSDVPLEGTILMTLVDNHYLEKINM